MKQYYAYILSNASRMLYVGVTNDLMRRMSEHLARSSILSEYRITGPAVTTFRSRALRP